MTKWKASLPIPIRFLFDSYSTPFMHLGVRFPTDRNHSQGLCFRFSGSIPNPSHKPSAQTLRTNPPQRTRSQHPTRSDRARQNVSLHADFFKANFPISQRWLRIFLSEMKKVWTGTNQAFFSSRRALLIQRVVKVPFFRFGGSPDWLGWRSFGRWSGHLSIFPALACREVLTLVEDAYLRWRGS